MWFQTVWGVTYPVGHFCILWGRARVFSKNAWWLNDAPTADVTLRVSTVNFSVCFDLCHPILVVQEINSFPYIDNLRKCVWYKQKNPLSVVPISRIVLWIFWIFLCSFLTPDAFMNVQLQQRYSDSNDNVEFPLNCCMLLTRVKTKGRLCQSLTKDSLCLRSLFISPNVITPH